MDHGLELISPILEILEIEVFIFARILGTSEFVFLVSPILETLEILVFPIFYHPGNIGN